MLNTLIFPSLYFVFKQTTILLEIHVISQYAWKKLITSRIYYLCTCIFNCTINYEETLLTWRKLNLTKNNISGLLLQ